MASTRRQTMRYRYDALGRRVQRYFAGTKENTKFIYDGNDVLVDDNSGVLTKYLNGDGIDNKLRQTTGSTVQYFLTDHLGSTNGLADASGNLTSSASYDSFGNATGNINTRYQFTGREFDNFTGLHYYRARWYDGNLGRFISEDPIGFGGGDVNLYGYVWNEPQQFTDPEGLGPIIKLGRFVVERGLKYLIDTGKKLTKKQAQNVRRNGGQIIVEGNDAQRAAKQIEDGAFKNDRKAGKRLRHDAHGDEQGFLPHYQTNNKVGHTFYKAGAVIFLLLLPNLADAMENDCITKGQIASAALWDGTNLVDPTGIAGAFDAYYGLDGGKGGLEGFADYANSGGLSVIAPTTPNYSNLLRNF